MQTLKHLHEKISRDKTAVFTFGRMNPPTIGHEKLINKIKDVANKHRADWFVYLSSSQDSKKNPLSFDRKIFYARKMFGRDVNQKTFQKNLLHFMPLQHFMIKVIKNLSWLLAQIVSVSLKNL